MNESLIFIVLAAVVVITFVVMAARSGGKRYEGRAPYQGPVAKFGATSGRVVEQSGEQRDTTVTP